MDEQLVWIEVSEIIRVRSIPKPQNEESRDAEVLDGDVEIEVSSGQSSVDARVEDGIHVFGNAQILACGRFLGLRLFNDRRHRRPECVWNVNGVDTARFFAQIEFLALRLFDRRRR